MTHSQDLVLDSLVKNFGSARAVDGIDLTIRKGEFVSLLGPSGCGKSTTLMMIAGFERADAGAIHIRGKRVDHLPPERRDIGIVFQAYALFPHLSVRENVEYGLRMRKVKAEERKRVAGEMLELVHMSAFADRDIKRLSGGQQQRVALARALAIRPDVLLLDEPFSALDRKLREELQREIRMLQRSLGITTIFVTHDQEEALLMSDRIAVMYGGKIEQCAAPETLYNCPATEFVAGFIGRGNLLRPGSPIAVRAGADALFDDGGKPLFFRPEAVRKPGGADGLEFAGKVRSIYFHGSARLAEVEIAETRDSLLIDMSAFRDETIRENDRIRFGVPAESLVRVSP
ncbi:ABC transporter ATP-binding protein [Pigmentiphaga sp. H8]|uniref:ABC transporter ATP-binding protein n=1 Tax=unclassified Pigmentiphaga TaxID=2626614 RepID=UPI000F5939F8|nr:ABC transporter ATP-binding protein [Pigmentiphaga sp. H8]AZG09104.1 ABC transporter ATP-binding protein [Pigmentiphaga sp. H8]